jgi:hypothetical protein
MEAVLPLQEHKTISGAVITLTGNTTLVSGDQITFDTTVNGDLKDLRPITTVVYSH